MHSSISSSEAIAAGTVVRRLAPGLAPTLCVFAALLALAEIWAWMSPPGPPRDIEWTLLTTQLQRSSAVAGAPLTVLTIGDSSALMDIDQLALGRGVGGRTESLATTGFVGPAGYGRMLQQWSRAGGRTETLLVVIHGSSTRLDDETYRAGGFEAFVLSGTAPAGSRWASRDKLWLDVVVPLLRYPLAGVYGVRYGSAPQLAERIRAERGGLVDPNSTLPEVLETSPFRFELSAAFRARMAALAGVVHAAPATRVRWALAPIPANRLVGGAPGARAGVIAALRQWLGPGELRLPSSLPAAAFATVTHLNADGRQQYTAAVAAALQVR